MDFQPPPEELLALGQSSSLSVVYLSQHGLAPTQKSAWLNILPSLKFDGSQ